MYYHHSSLFDNILTLSWIFSHVRCGRAGYRYDINMFTCPSSLFYPFIWSVSLLLQQSASTHRLTTKSTTDLSRSNRYPPCVSVLWYRRAIKMIIWYALLCTDKTESLLSLFLSLLRPRPPLSIYLLWKMRPGSAAPKRAHTHIHTLNFFLHVCTGSSSRDGHGSDLPLSLSICYHQHQ